MELDTIICGDNATVMATFPDACIDLVVTSPPYDDLRKYGGHSWDFPAVARELTRILKPGGVIVWVVGDATVDGSETLTSMRQAIHFRDVCGLKVWDTMIYRTNKPPQSGRRYDPCWEFMFCLSRGVPSVFNGLREPTLAPGVMNSGGMRRTDAKMKPRTRIGRTGDDRLRENIWYLPRSPASGDSYRLEHPATFPDELSADHILSWSNPGDVVLDPFAGSGTTLKMAKEHGRRWIGIEVNPAYVEICRKRVAQGVLPLVHNNPQICTPERPL
jgi:site-specific DNA-methyltransferase (adenine-specific)